MVDTQGNGWLRKRTMVENNEEPTPRLQKKCLFLYGQLPNLLCRYTTKACGPEKK